METKNYKRLKEILIGSNLHPTEVNEVAELIDLACEEYHQDKLKKHGVLADVVGQSELCKHEKEPILDEKGFSVCPDCNHWFEFR